MALSRDPPHRAARGPPSEPTVSHTPRHLIGVSCERSPRNAMAAGLFGCVSGPAPAVETRTPCRSARAPPSTRPVSRRRRMPHLPPAETLRTVYAPAAEAEERESSPGRKIPASGTHRPFEFDGEPLPNAPRQRFHRSPVPTPSKYATTAPYRRTRLRDVRTDERNIGEPATMHFGLRLVLVPSAQHDETSHGRSCNRCFTSSMARNRTSRDMVHPDTSGPPVDDGVVRVRGAREHNLRKSTCGCHATPRGVHRRFGFGQVVAGVRHAVRGSAATLPGIGGHRTLAPVRPDGCAEVTISRASPAVALQQQRGHRHAIVGRQVTTLSNLLRMLTRAPATTRVAPDARGRRLLHQHARRRPCPEVPWAWARLHGTERSLVPDPSLASASARSPHGRRRGMGRTA